MVASIFCHGSFKSYRSCSLAPQNKQQRNFPSRNLNRRIVSSSDYRRHARNNYFDRLKQHETLVKNYTSRFQTLHETDHQALFGGSGLAIKKGHYYSSLQLTYTFKRGTKHKKLRRLALCAFIINSALNKLSQKQLAVCKHKKYRIWSNRKREA